MDTSTSTKLLYYGQNYLQNRGRELALVPVPKLALVLLVRCSFFSLDSQFFSRSSSVSTPPPPLTLTLTLALVLIRLWVDTPREGSTGVVWPNSSLTDPGPGSDPGPGPDPCVVRGCCWQCGVW